MCAEILMPTLHVCNQMLVVDLDGGKILKCYGDEDQIIPPKLQKALIVSLKDDTGR
jgi:predicted esterase